MKRVVVAALVFGSACATQRPLVRWADQVHRWCVTGAFVFDGRARQGPMDVFVRGEVIDAVTPTTGPQPACLDGRGKTLTPGLIDAHVHLGLSAGHAPWDLRVPDLKQQLDGLLYSGVTTALDAATSRGLDEVLAQEAPFARLVRASRIITAEGGHPGPMIRAGAPWPIADVMLAPMLAPVSGDTTDVEAVLSSVLASKPDVVKVVYDDMPPGAPHLSHPMLVALLSAAKARGVRVVVHVGSATEAIEAAEAGASLLMHTPWETVLTDEEVRRLAATKVPIVTTRRVHGALTEVLEQRVSLHALEREVRPDVEPAIHHRPEGFAMRGLDASQEHALARYDANLKENVRRLHEAGVVLVAGTDSGLPNVIHGAALHRELQALVASGFTTTEALASATSIAAKVLLPGEHVGVIEPGARADLLLVEGDPLDDVTALEHVVGVWRSGRPVERAR
ncbi:MAG: amidohydrolase family protein [Archangium sp.]|nr:amidohydrolase family protein [Archangium sp.]